MVANIIQRQAKHLMEAHSERQPLRANRPADPRPVSILVGTSLRVVGPLKARQLDVIQLIHPGQR